ncbi:MAG: DNA cytosine methyltransferase [Bacteroidota bacterium]
MFSSLEICAGAGGQALGLEMAGFEHVAAVEIDKAASETLRLNRPNWNPLETDVKEFSAHDYCGIDLFAGGVPCPPFSIAGKQLGADDERDLFPSALRIVEESKPLAVMLENVRGLSSARFAGYRKGIIDRLLRLGYHVDWQVVNACSYGVPQLRPRFILVAIKHKYAKNFAWPQPVGTPPTVGQTLRDLMGSCGWKGASAWAERAKGIAPTLVGGSKKHGGPDLGPTRAKLAWQELGINGHGLGDAPPDQDFPIDGLPKLTVRMAARIQGFPDEWQFSGKKTAAYRQIGNVFPPPVAYAVGMSIIAALKGQAIPDPLQIPLFTEYE